MSAVSNPFAPSKKKMTQEDTLDIRDDLMGDDLIVTGPTHPGLSPTLEAPSTAWETQDIGQLEGFAIMGLHGGAGATTLSTLLGSGASDIGNAWPISHNAWTGKPWPIPVIAVARNDYSGLKAADRFVRSWANGQLTGAHLSALVLIDAGPRMSDARRKTTKRLLRMVPRGTHLPWMESWLESPPDPSRLPLRIKRIIKLLNTQTATD